MKDQRFTTVKRIAKWLEQEVLPENTQYSVLKRGRTLDIVYAVTSWPPLSKAHGAELYTWRLEWAYSNGLYSLQPELMEQLPKLIKHKCFVDTDWFKCRCGADIADLETKKESPRLASVLYTPRMVYYHCRRCQYDYYWAFRPFKSAFPQKGG
jgi:hypothetical protein